MLGPDVVVAEPACLFRAGAEVALGGPERLGSRRRSAAEQPHRVHAQRRTSKFEVTQCETSPALADLRSHEIDLVVGIDYDPVPVARHRDVDRRDLVREDVLLALPPQHPALTKRGPVPVAACEDAARATGHGGTGLDAVVRNVCNRLGGFEPDIRHRSDDALVLSALAASGRAVALFPALLAMTMPQIAVRRLREKRLQRTIFTATRTTTSDAPAVVAARTAFAETARRAAAQRPNLAVRAYRM